MAEIDCPNCNGGTYSDSITNTEVICTVCGGTGKIDNGR